MTTMFSTLEKLKNNLDQNLCLLVGTSDNFKKFYSLSLNNFFFNCSAKYTVTIIENKANVADWWNK